MSSLTTTTSGKKPTGVAVSEQAQPDKAATRAAERIYQRVLGKGPTTKETDIWARIIASEYEEVRELLEEIQEGKGRYSRIQLTHANNTIEEMKELAGKALDHLDGGG